MKYLKSYRCGTIFRTPQGIFMLCSRNIARGVSCAEGYLAAVVLKWTQHVDHFRPGTLISFNELYVPEEIIGEYEYDDQD